MTRIEITSIHDPRIADYRAVRDAELRRDRFDAPGGLFVAEGDLVVRRLLASRFQTSSLLVTPSRLAIVQDTLGPIPDDVPVYVVDQEVMNGVVGFNIHRGLLALGIRGPEPSLPDLLAAASCIVVLEDLANHDNLGGIFRNVAALAGVGPGGGAVLLSPRCADPLYRKSIRVSVGWALSVPFARLTEWPAQLGVLRDAGYRVLALHPDPDARDLADFSNKLALKPSKVALIVGTEGPGLTPQALHAADECIQIRMRGNSLLPPSTDPPTAADPTAADGIDSLNVATATAIALNQLAPALPRIGAHATPPIGCAPD